jgi:hypothetical protein
MDVKTKITKAVMEVRRFDRECNALLLGKKEMEEANKLPIDTAGLKWTRNTSAIAVEKDSFCKAVYITDREEEQKKLFGELTSK